MGVQHSCECKEGTLFRRDEANDLLDAEAVPVTEEVIPPVTIRVYKPGAEVVPSGPSPTPVTQSKPGGGEVDFAQEEQEQKQSPQGPPPANADRPPVKHLAPEVSAAQDGRKLRTSVTATSMDSVFSGWDSEEDLSTPVPASSVEVPPPSGSRRSSAPMADFRKTGKVICVGVRLSHIIRVGHAAEVGPVRCAIPFDALNKFNKKAKEMLGKEYATATARAVVRGIIQPECQSTGKSYARIINEDSPCLGQIFVCHCWDANWPELVASINAAFQGWAQKPTLWICCFALFQSPRRAPIHLEDAPFAAALKQAQALLVVRSKEVDIYKRLWPMWEMYLSHKMGMLQRKDGLLVAGPDAFDRTAVDSRKAETADQGDAFSIWRAIQAETSHEELISIVSTVRESANVQKPSAKAGVKAAAKAAATKAKDKAKPAAQGTPRVLQ